MGYIRVSTEEQATRGVSLEAQTQQVQSYCVMRGLDLIEVVTDAGVSAAKRLDTRPGGARVAELLRKRQASGVVAWRLDRLFRDCAECLTTVAEWDRAGVALHMVDMGGQTFDTSTAMGRFFVSIMAAAAELERNVLRERTRAGMAVRKAQGKRVGSVPFGFRLTHDGTTLAEDAREQKVLVRIRRLRARGVPLRDIVERLNRDQVPARGSRWHLTTVVHLTRRLAA